MAAAAGNTLLCDGAGRPLRPAISWMDRRAENAPLYALSGLDADTLRQVTGWPCLSSFPLAHLAWLAEHEPERYRAAQHVGMDTDWLLFRLTGKWAMDHSTATTFHLQEQTGGTYYAPFLKRLGLRRGRLSALSPSGTTVGPLTPQAAADTGLSGQTLAVTGCFDHPAAARATGVVSPGQLMLSCGTSWVGFLPHADRQALVDAHLLCDPFLSAHGGPWGGMFSVPRVGNAIDWYIGNVIAPGEPDPLRVFDALAAEAPPGARGLRIDLLEPPGRVAASRADVSRAVMESAAGLLNERLAALAGRGLRYRQAVMVGGPSRSPVWPGIVAEATGLDIATGGRSAGARGAALLAGAGVRPDLRDGRKRAHGGRPPRFSAGS
jgi:sugar (pentulose or hexulose) kinase